MLIKMDLDVTYFCTAIFISFYRVYYRVVRRSYYSWAISNKLKQDPYYHFHISHLVLKIKLRNTKIGNALCVNKNCSHALSNTKVQSLSSSGQTSPGEIDGNCFNRSFIFYL